MEYNKSQKNLTAKHLKDLRMENKLSHEKLAEILSRTYYKDEQGGIIKRTEDSPKYDEFVTPNTISSGVLKNYELTTDKDVAPSRMKAGFGMSISYIAMFADFYGVSVDYLLGLAPYPSTDLDVKAINEKTGLSEKAIEYLISYNKSKDSRIGVLNSLFDTAEFDKLLEGIFLLRIDAINKGIFEKNNEEFSKAYKQMPEMRIHGGTAVLNQAQYYDFMRIQLMESFHDLIKRMIESPIENMSIEDVLKERRLLNAEWNNANRVIW